VLERPGDAQERRRAKQDQEGIGTRLLGIPDVEGIRGKEQGSGMGNERDPGKVSDEEPDDRYSENARNCRERSQ
jgi:hypothetical protein